MWKKILGGIVIFIVLVVSVVMYATSGMSDTANEFFIYIKSKHYDDAYNMLSEDFKNSTSESTFEQFLKQSTLTKYKSVSWSERSIEGNTGILKGTVHTKSGGIIPITIKFIKDDNDEWKIYSIYKPKSGIETNQNSRDLEDDKSSFNERRKSISIPSQQKIISLVQETMLIFAKSVNEKSMNRLYNYSATYFQNHYSKEQLDRAFQPFYKLGIDLTPLKDIKPIIDNKEIKQGRIMIIKGHYPTSPSIIYFKNSYYIEDGKWRLVGIKVNIK